MKEFKEAVSDYENLFRNYLLSEIFTNMLIPDSDLEAMVVITRMTGYDQDDIYEYMEGSFRDIMWEWSYLWLIMGEFISKYAGRIRPTSLQSDTSHP